MAAPRFIYLFICYGGNYLSGHLHLQLFPRILSNAPRLNGFTVSTMTACYPAINKSQVHTA